MLLTDVAQGIADTSPPSVGNGKAIATLILFFLANLFVIWNPSIKRSELTNGTPVQRTPTAVPPFTAPVAAVILLLMSQVLSAQTLRDGIVGRNGIQPLNIMALFISLAYMSISLDHTGFFKWLAWKVAGWGGTAGRWLYFFLYLLFLVISTVFGNDPVVLSGTPFLAQFTHVSELDATPWIFAQLTAANMASVVFVSSNPTNLVVAGAFKITFLSYAAHVVVPFIVAAICVYPVFLLIYCPARTQWAYWNRLRGPRSVSQNIRTSHTTIPGGTQRSGLVSMPPPEQRPTVVAATFPDAIHESKSLGSVRKHEGPAPDVIDRALPIANRRDPSPTAKSTINAPDTSPLPKLIKKQVGEPDPPHDLCGAVTTSVLFVACLCILVALSTQNVPVYQVTVPFAVFTVIRDASYDVYCHLKHKSLKELELELKAIGASGRNVPAPAPASKYAPRSNLLERSLDGALTWIERLLEPITRRQHIASTWLGRKIPTVWTVVKALPVGLLPFAFSMFTLVQGLATLGWVEVFARWWAAWVRTTGLIGAIGGMGFITCLLCNCCGTNIGATILLARVLQVWAMAPSSSSGAMLSPRTRDGAIYALALASNFGAFTLTFPASLAGLLWRGLLVDKGIHVAPSQFVWLNLPVSFVAMLTASVVLVAEMYILY